MKIVPVVKRVSMKDTDESYEDMLYWLSKTPKERMEAVTMLRASFIKPGERLNKSVVVKRKMHP